MAFTDRGSSRQLSKGYRHEYKMIDSILNIRNQINENVAKF